MSEECSYKLPDSFSVKAVLLGQRIDLKNLSPETRISLHPLVLRLQSSVLVAIFRYGAVVLINGADKDLESVQKLLQGRVERPIDSPLDEFTEELLVTTHEGATDVVKDECVELLDLSLSRLQLVAEVLARSVLVSYYESHIRDTFVEVEPVARGLAGLSSDSVKIKNLKKQIGLSLLSEHHLVGRVEVTEKPDLLWSSNGLDPLYHQLEEELEISERALAIRRKIDLISRTASTIVELIHAQRSIALEWAIVILIVVEIVFTIAEHI